MYVWIAAAVLLLCVGGMLSTYRRDRLGTVLLILLPIAAAIFIFGVVQFNDVTLPNTDCVDVCVSSFSFYLGWIAALGGGGVYFALLILAAIRAATVRGSSEESSRATSI